MSKITHECFYDQIVKPLVEDLITYHEENKAQFGTRVFFPQETRYICINSRRQLGYTYSAIKLLYDYPPSIIFVHDFRVKKHILANEFYPLVSEHQILTYEQALDVHKTDGRYQYKLAIIDVGYYLDIKNMRLPVLDALFNRWADFVIEFS